MATAQATKSNTITLRGSAQIVAEFFYFSINSILYQRGIYDADSFDSQRQYGLPMMVSTDQGLTTYLSNVIIQLEAWLTQGRVKKLVIVITAVEEEEVLERWVFDVQTNETALSGTEEVQGKTKVAVTKEIAAIIRQITSSVSFLPLLEVPCTFDLLVYTHAQCEVPTEWEESDPRYISKSNEVRLRSFTTKIHKVEASVAYKADDDDYP